MVTKTEVTEMIDALVADQTFSLEAVDRVKAIRDANIELTEELEKAEAALERKRTEVRELATAKDTVLQQLDEARQKIEATQQLVAQAEAFKARAEKEAAVATAYRDAMQIVFKPHTVRESVCKNVPVAAPPNGYVSTYTKSTTTTTEHD